MQRLEDWIDFMEGESNHVQHGRLGLLLKHSIADRLVFENVRRLRCAIKDADAAELLTPLLNNERFMADMHQSIMARIREERPIETSSPPPDHQISQAICKF